MKLHVKLVSALLVIFLQVHDSFANYTTDRPDLRRIAFDPITAGINLVSSVFNLGASCVGLSSQLKAGSETKEMLKAVEKGTTIVATKLDEMHERQTKQANEIFVNTMLQLNNIEGKLDYTNNQIVDLQGKILDVSKMLHKLDGALKDVNDLLRNIDSKMDRFSKQV